MAAELFLGALFFGLGAVVGTFLTTCIERLPFEEDGIPDDDEEERPEWYYRIPMLSLFIAMPLYTRFKSLLPRARCPACGHRLGLLEMVPVLSFALQGGRCAACRFKIPGRHMLVEALTGALFALFAVRFGLSLELAAALVISALFVVATVVDLRFQIIPDEVNLLGLIAGFFLALGRSSVATLGDLRDLWTTTPSSLTLDALRPVLEQRWLLDEGSLGWSVTGFLAGAGALMLLYYVGTAIARTEAMGGGDVKLAGFIGLFLGAKGVLVALFWSTILGAVFGVLILVAGWGVKEGGFTKFAFGPYICAGTLLTVYFGVDSMIDAYVSVNALLLPLLTPSGVSVGTE